MTNNSNLTSFLFVPHSNLFSHGKLHFNTSTNGTNQLPYPIVIQTRLLTGLPNNTTTAMFLRSSPFHLQNRHITSCSPFFTLKKATYRAMFINSTSHPTARTSSADTDDQTSVIPPDGRWTHHTPPSSPSSLSRTFHFKTFKAAWSFMTAVAEECKKRRHHPEWSNVYNTVFVRWTTHRPRDPNVSPGITRVDIEMAGYK